MALPHDEQVSAEALNYYLLRCGLISTFLPVPEDPPDVVFHVTREKQESWATEITGMFQYVGFEDGEKNYMSFLPALKSGLEKLSTQLGKPLQHSYYLNVKWPIPSQILSSIGRRVRSYISAGKTEEEYLDYDDVLAGLLKDTQANGVTLDLTNPSIVSTYSEVAKEKCRVSIRAEDNDKGNHRVVLFAGPGGADTVPNSSNLVADVDATLDYSLERILAAKAPRMKQVCGYDKKVLLIWNTIPFATAENTKSALAKHNTTVFDAIFLLEGTNQITLLIDNGLDLTCHSEVDAKGWTS